MMNGQTRGGVRGSRGHASQNDGLKHGYQSRDMVNIYLQVKNESKEEEWRVGDWRDVEERACLMFDGAMLRCWECNMRGIRSTKAKRAL